MKHATILLILLICLAALTLPVAAAKDDGSNAASTANKNDDSPGQAEGAKGASPSADIPAAPVRETIREEARIENQSAGQFGQEVQNRTEARIEQQETVHQAGTPPGQNISESREIIRTSQQEMAGTGTEGGTQQYANQNEVRLAVHALLVIGNTSGGIGSQVSAIAREFNNSAQSSWQLEERIQDRDAFTRFLFGGDRTAATELAGQTVQNQERIQQIEQLMATESLDTETRTMLEEQLRILEQENTRLNQVSSVELESKGIFGWFTG